MFELKALSKEGIPAALKKAERYRLLNEPWEAESICHDILDTDPENREAQIILLLSLTDQIRGGRDPKALDKARVVAGDLDDEYDRAYYTGIIYERLAKSVLARGGPGSGHVAYGWLRQAMTWYEQALTQDPPGYDDAVLRWNTCARMIMGDESLRPDEDRPVPAYLE